MCVCVLVVSLCVAGGVGTTHTHDVCVCVCAPRITHDFHKMQTNWTIIQLVRRVARQMGAYSIGQVLTH